MTVLGKVKEINGREVTVSVVRNGACGGNCKSCGGCSERTVDAKAFCDINVQPGDVVELSSHSSYVYLGMVSVFLMPVIFPVLGYIFFAKIGITAACAAAVILFVLSVIIIWRISKSEKYLQNVTPSVVRVVYKK